MGPKKDSKKSGTKSTALQRGKRKNTNGKQDRESPPAKSLKLESSDSAAPSKSEVVASPENFTAKARAVRDNYNLKLTSWNVNGVRSWIERSGLNFLRDESPDVFCIQETKCQENKIPAAIKNIDGYYSYWTSAEKPGYSGVGILSKIRPINVTYGIGVSEHDTEGRVITAEYEKFFVVTAYVPNSGRGLVRLDYRMSWDRDFFQYLNTLASTKQVILCGDLNVAHQEIDIARPSSNRKNAGFTKEERDSFGMLLNEGFFDTFRYLYPDVSNIYTFWTFMRNARESNIGWRLDYFVCSNELADNIHDSVIHGDVMGSDHCPVSLLLEI